jgi:hypothetical protein
VLPPDRCHRNQREQLYRQFQTTRQAAAATVDDWAQGPGRRTAPADAGLRALDLRTMKAWLICAGLNAPGAAFGPTVDSDDACSWIS